MQPIEVPEIQADELKEVTDNFGQDSLIGEGSYGRVYYGVLKSGQAAAIKKLDASKQPDEEFLAQVYMCDNLGSVFYVWSLKLFPYRHHVVFYAFRFQWYQG